MAKGNIELTLNKTQVDLVRVAIGERKSKLDKLVTNLLKERQGDAAKPILSQLEGLAEIEALLVEPAE